MTTLKSITNAMKYLAKHNPKLTYREERGNYFLSRNDVAFHGSIVRIEKTNGEYKIMDLSEKLDNLVSF